MGRRSYLNPKLICDNKKFWKTVKPLFSGKSTQKSKIVLIQNNEIIYDYLEVAETLDVFFTDDVKQMELVNEFSTPLINGDSTIISAILTGYSDHPSVLKIKVTLKISPTT